MNWDDLRYVLAIAQTRTLVGAARLLRVDHTTAGRRLVAIEKALNTRLFDRTIDGLRPTATGKHALARAREVEEQMTALEREVSGHDALRKARSALRPSTRSSMAFSSRGWARSTRATPRSN